MTDDADSLHLFKANIDLGLQGLLGNMLYNFFFKSQVVAVKAKDQIGHDFIQWQSRTKGLHGLLLLLKFL